MHCEVFDFIFVVDLVLTELKKPLFGVYLPLKRSLAKSGQFNIFLFKNSYFVSEPSNLVSKLITVSFLNINYPSEQFIDSYL